MPCISLSRPSSVLPCSSRHAYPAQAFPLLHVICLTPVCDMTHAYVRHDSLLCVKFWLHTTFFCVTCVTHILFDSFILGSLGVLYRIMRDFWKIVRKNWTEKSSEIIFFHFTHYLVYSNVTWLNSTLTILEHRSAKSFEFNVEKRSCDQHHTTHSSQWGLSE